MFKSAAAEKLFIVPVASWDSKLTISPKHDHLKLKNWKNEIGDPEDMAAPLICGVNGKERLQVIARNKDGTLDWVKPNAYTFSFAGEGCAEISASESVLELKGLKLTEAPLVLTVTLKERPELSASLSVTVEKPQQLWLFEDGSSYLLDLQRRELLDVKNKPQHCNAGDVCLKHLNMHFSGSAWLHVLAGYRDGRCAWLNCGEIQAGVSDPQVFAINTSLLPYAIIVETCEYRESDSHAVMTVKSAADPDVQCSVRLSCQSAYKGEGVLDDVRDDYSVCLLTGFKENADPQANRDANSRIYSGASILQFGCKKIEMRNAETDEYSEEALLLYSHPERRNDFITLLRSACRFCGLDYVLLLENGQVYKLFASGDTEPRGNWAGTAADLEKHYGACRGAALRCGGIVDRHLYREGPGSFAGAMGYQAAKNTLQDKAVDYFSCVFNNHKQHAR